MSDIINCYHDRFSGGIGDFIKGSIYLYSRSVRYGIEVDMDWSKHPIGEFIYSDCSSNYDTKYVIDIEDLRGKFLPNSTKNNMSSWIDYIIESVVTDKKYRPATLSSWYSNADENQGVDKIEQIKTFNIGKKCKEHIRKKINFSPKIDQIFNKQKLTSSYGIIHFRLGDRHTLPNIEQEIGKFQKPISENYNLKKFDHDYDYYYYLIKKEKKKNNLKKIIVMSDSNDFKKFIEEESQHNKDILVLHQNSAHTSNQPGLLKYTDFKKTVSKDQYKYTIFDLKCIINSTKNITYSCYNWGSGFIIWPSKLYDIPLEIKLLDQ